MPSLALPKMPALPDMTPSAEPITQHQQAVGSATEIYARIARGANSCWFGASGPLKKDYVYNAEADAPSRGGRAEITIHSRDTSQPNPRGPKAYKVKIEPKDETAALVTENLLMPEPMAAGMTSDVGRWAKGDQGCAGSSTVAGWGVPAPAPAPPPTAEKKPAKKPVKTAKAANQPKTP